MNQRKSSDHFSNATLVKYVPIQQGEPQKFCGFFLLYIHFAGIKKHNPLHTYGGCAVWAISKIAYV